MTEKEMLEKAEKEYPVGTVYYTAHLNTPMICTRSKDKLYVNKSGYLMESDGDSKKNGHNFSEVIYDPCKKRWAKIIQSPIDNFKFML